MKTIISLILFSCLTMGCNTHKKATRHLLKATAGNPLAVAAWCGKLHPPVTLVKDSLVYKPGSIPGRVYVYANCDSLRAMTQPNVAGKIKLPCPAILQVDTVFLYKERHLVNNAEITMLTEQLTKLSINYSELRNTKKILLYTVFILALYTGVRWLLRIWGIKLP